MVLVNYNKRVCVHTDSPWPGCVFMVLVNYNKRACAYKGSPWLGCVFWPPVALVSVPLS